MFPNNNFKPYGADMNQFVFVSDKKDVAAEASDLQNFDKVSRILTERFGFKIRYNRHGVFDFFYHSDFKENIIEYSGGELRVRNPSDPLIDRMTEIAAVFPSAKVLGDDGAWYVSGTEIYYPAASIEEGLAAAVTDETVSKGWRFLKIGMAVAALLILAVVLDKFVF